MIAARLAAAALVVIATAAPAAAADQVTFRHCPQAPAGPAGTNLMPGRVTGADDAAYELQPEAGVVRLLGVTRLDLPDGRIAAGAGFDALVARSEGGFVRVADGSATASVTRAVIDYDSGDSRVAYVELRLGTTPPVRWEAEEKLLISTDGGDGGFWTAAARRIDPGDAPIDTYVDAGTSGPDSCLLRFSAGHDAPDGFTFGTGIGDGGYPTFLGYDARDRVVSVVNTGHLVPWALSGLPGEPPPEIAAWAAERRNPSARQARTAVEEDEDTTTNRWALRAWIALAVVAGVLGVLFVHRVNRDS